MAIGAIDPDAVMYVHLVDADGKIEFSYVRNEKNPSEIWLVKGDYTNSSRKPAQSRLIKTITLN